MENSKNDKSKSAPPDPILMDSAEAKFQNLISQAPVLIVTYYGPTFIIQTINKIALSVWKKSYDEVINKPLFEVAPELEYSLATILNEIYTSGEPYIANEISVEIKRTGKPDTAYFNMVYQPMRDLDNKIYGIILIGTEVTETVNARKLIEASEKRFSNILAQSIMFVGIFKGKDMIIAFANEPLLKIWGKELDIVGKPLFEVMPELKSQQFPKDLNDVYTKGITFSSNENRAIMTRNGTPEERFFSVVYQPYAEVDNTVTGVTVIGTEVTDYVLAKKQIEQSSKKINKIASHLKLATDSAKVGIWSLDLISLKLEWSNIHKKMWGYDESREDLTYEHWHTVIVPEDKEMALRKVEGAKVFPGIYEVDYRISRANDGVIVWIKSTGLYHYDKFGIAHTFTGISIDISEQKRIDAELTEAKKKAEADKKIADHAVMAKQQFLSNMSHEIRTPMNAIIGFTKVLMKTDLNEKQKEYLQAIKSSGDTLIVLIDDILDLAKVDAGKMIFINAPFKMSQSITTILHLFETKIQEKNLELVKEYDSRIPEILLGDSVRLHQIMINLLGNAIKFTAKGTINVSVSLLSEAEENVTVEIKVTDSGIGIPATKIASIFENFEQAHTITSSLYGGTGLGLAIVKQLVEKQGGAISVKSKVDEGSTFSFTLSFQKKQPDSDSYVEEEREIELDNEIKDIKVLVVEDVKLNQLLLRTILDDFKFAWDMADNGKIAIEKLETNDYDIILMDLQMPIMNGFEATEYIRNKMNLQTPIIALTADVTTVDVEKCKSVGMNDYISKPLDEKLLYSKILDLIK